MCCEQLVCAACAGRVSDGHCALCRAYRNVRHGALPAWTALAMPLLAVLAALLIMLALHLQLS